MIHYCDFEINKCYALLFAAFRFELMSVCYVQKICLQFRTPSIGAFLITKSRLNYKSFTLGHVVF